MLTPPAGLPSTTGTSSTSLALPLTTVINYAQLLGKTLYAQGDLSYLEAVNKETLRNSFTRFAESGIVTILPSSRDGKIPARVMLSEEWMSTRAGKGEIVVEEGWVLPEGQLWEFCERISRGRREGKNRRDGGTVVRRVLGLVELVGEKLWAQNAGSEVRNGKKGRKGKQARL